MKYSLRWTVWFWYMGLKKRLRTRLLATDWYWHTYQPWCQRRRDRHWRTKVWPEVRQRELELEARWEVEILTKALWAIPILEYRQELRAESNWAASDLLRDLISREIPGAEVRDTKAGPELYIPKWPRFRFA